MAWLLRQAAGARQRRRGAAAEQPALLPVADRIAFGFDGDGARADDQGASSPATRCAPRSRRCRRRRERFAGRSGPLRLLVVGGSLGAQGAQRDACRRRSRCSPARQRPRVTHQTGEANRDARAAPPTHAAGVAGRGAALHRRHGAPPRRVRRDRLPRRRDHGQRAVRRRRRRACWCRSSSARPRTSATTRPGWRRAAPAIHLPQARADARAAGAELLQRPDARRAAGDGRRRARALAPAACRGARRRRDSSDIVRRRRAA